MSKLHVIQVANGSNPYNNTIGGIVTYISDIVGVTTLDDKIDNSEMRHSIIGSGLPLFDGYICLSKKIYPNVVFLILLFLNLHRFPDSPSVVYHIHTNYLGLPFFLFKRKSKRILTVHGITDVTRKKRKTYAAYLLYRLLNIITVRGYHGLIADTQAALDHFSKRYRVKEGCKECVIPTGVNTNVFYPKDKLEYRQKHGISPQSKVFLFAGRFVWEKNIELILDAYSIFSRDYRGDCCLLLIGDGYLMAKIRAIVSKKQLSDVFFLGSLSRNEVSEHMSLSDVFIITSFIEGGPITLKEALACNLPVVSVPVGDVKEVLPDFPGCLLCEYDASSISTALMDVVTSKESIDYSDAIVKYSMTEFRSKIIDFYREIVSD